VQFEREARRTPGTLHACLADFGSMKPLAYAAPRVPSSFHAERYPLAVAPFLLTEHSLCRDTLHLKTIHLSTRAHFMPASWYPLCSQT
jgi:hypothetical protein